jgi:hypothetical protein
MCTTGYFDACMQSWSLFAMLSLHPDPLKRRRINWYYMPDLPNGDYIGWIKCFGASKDRKGTFLSEIMAFILC